MTDELRGDGGIERIRAELAAAAANDGADRCDRADRVLVWVHNYAPALLDEIERLRAVEVAAQRLRANAGGPAVTNTAAHQVVPLLYWQQLCTSLDAALPQDHPNG